MEQPELAAGGNGLNDFAGIGEFLLVAGKEVGR